MDKIGLNTEQEIFWSSNFGNNYIKRNRSFDLFLKKYKALKNILSSLNNIETVIEFGANIGLNLLAIHEIFPKTKLYAVDINKKAITELKKIKGIEHIFEDSILTFKNNLQYDMVLSAGLLIHINPDMLHKAYKTIYNSTKKYILIDEYYNPTPVEVEYRGNKGKLFKRDFVGEMMAIYPDLKLIDYGFCYHMDNNYFADDSTWFLIERA